MMEAEEEEEEEEKMASWRLEPSADMMASWLNVWGISGAEASVIR